jgi:hypothetical protein
VVDLLLLLRLALLPQLLACLVLGLPARLLGSRELGLYLGGALAKDAPAQAGHRVVHDLVALLVDVRENGRLARLDVTDERAQDAVVALIGVEVDHAAREQTHRSAEKHPDGSCHDADQQADEAS